MREKYENVTSWHVLFWIMFSCSVVGFAIFFGLSSFLIVNSYINPESFDKDIITMSSIVISSIIICFVCNRSAHIILNKMEEKIKIPIST